MRAYLLDVDSWMTPMLVSACGVVGLPLTRSTSLPALVAMTERGRERDLVVLDCARELHKDVETCCVVVRELTLPVHVLYTSESFLQAMRAVVPTVANWIPANIGWLDLLDALYHLQQRAYSAQLQQMYWAPSPQQRAVLALLGEERSHTEIAGALGIQPGTVKTHVKRLMEKFDVDTVDELQAIFHIMFQRESQRPWRVGRRGTPAFTMTAR